MSGRSSTIIFLLILKRGTVKITAAEVEHNSLPGRLTGLAKLCFTDTFSADHGSGWAYPVRLEVVAKLHFHAPRFFHDIFRIPERMGLPDQWQPFSTSCMLPLLMPRACCCSSVVLVDASSDKDSRRCRSCLAVLKFA